MDLREYKTLLDDTYNLYKEYKIDPLNDTLYNSIRLNLSKLDTLVITGKVPSDLIYKTNKVISSMYRLLERPRLEIKKTNNHLKK